jgi:hypothetical protein
MLALAVAAANIEIVPFVISYTTINPIKENILSLRVKQEAADRPHLFIVTTALPSRKIR